MIAWCKMETTKLSKYALGIILLGLGASMPQQVQAQTQDAYGDPLPPGALFRLGTQRLRHGAITSLAWSPDGKWVASAAGLGNVNSARVWDAATGKLVSQCQHQAGGRTVAFS